MGGPQPDPGPAPACSKRKTIVTNFVAPRRRTCGLEPVGKRVEESARSTSKSAVSRRFVAATETALAELLAPLGELDVVALLRLRTKVDEPKTKRVFSD